MIQAIIGLIAFIIGFILLIIWAVQPGYGPGDFLITLVLAVILLMAVPITFELIDLFRGESQQGNTHQPTPAA